MSAITGSSPSKGKYKPNELIEVRVKPTSNGGATVHCERAGKNGDMEYSATKPAAFSTMKEAAEYVEKELGVGGDEPKPKAKMGIVDKKPDFFQRAK